MDYCTDFNERGHGYGKDTCSDDQLIWERFYRAASRRTKKRGLTRGLIVTDSFLYKSGAADRVGSCLLMAGLEYAVYYLVQPNPTIEVVEECLKAAVALEIDVLVAVGGGSAIDTAKAVSIVLANGGQVKDYEGVGKSRSQESLL